MAGSGEQRGVGEDDGGVAEVPGCRLTVVSDTHLSAATPEALTNWDTVVEHVDAERPDLVVHLGDLSLDGAHRPADLPAARRQLDRLGAEWRAIPGNHDIGDNPYLGQAAGEVIDQERRQRWRDEIGEDWWCLDVDGWKLVAVDAQLFGSRLAAEAEQREWLDDELSRAGGPVVFLSHKPLVAPDEELAVAPPYRFVPSEGRRWLGAAPLVVSGHVHQHRTLILDGVRHEWAPTTWAVLPDDVQPTFGAKVCGALSIELHAGEVPIVTLVEPAGLRQLTLLRDVANPYAH